MQREMGRRNFLVTSALAAAAVPLFSACGLEEFTVMHRIEVDRSESVLNATRRRVRGVHIERQHLGTIVGCLGDVCGDWVFEVNGARVVGHGVSVEDIMVNRGDILVWKYR